jgi:uncharacterized DUF497 family protein
MSFGKINIQHDGFDWDEFNSGKVKSRMPLEVVENFFEKDLLVREDKRHSLSEQRFIAMGELGNRVLFVAFTMRKMGSEILIRVISSRYVHTGSKEREFYEKAKEFIEKNKR